MSNQKVIVLRGLPASGKTTFAKEWVAKDPTNRVRVNKDDLRAMLHGGHWSKGNEKQVVQLEEEIIINSLILGKSVVVDNTHLATNKDGTNKHLRRIQQLVEANPLLEQYQYSVLEDKIKVELHSFNVLPEEAIKRDLKRENSVGSDVIWRMYWDHVAAIKKPEYDISKTDAIIVDVDGTLAQMEGRHPYQWDKVGTDSVREHIKELVNVFCATGYKIIVLTGRDGCCYAETKKWLADNGITYDSLFSRPIGDNRKDFIVKKEIYDYYIAPYYNIRLVVDDRPQVIREWRRLGLPVINANPCDREF